MQLVDGLVLHATDARDVARLLCRWSKISLLIGLLGVCAVSCNNVLSGGCVCVTLHGKLIAWTSVICVSGVMTPAQVGGVRRLIDYKRLSRGRGRACEHATMSRRNAHPRGRGHATILSFLPYFYVRRWGPTCITVPNLIKIGGTVADIWRFNAFFKWRPPAILELLGAYRDNPR